MQDEPLDEAELEKRARAVYGSMEAAKRQADTVEEAEQYAVEVLMGALRSASGMEIEPPEEPLDRRLINALWDLAAIEDPNEQETVARMVAAGMIDDQESADRSMTAVGRLHRNVYGEALAHTDPEEGGGSRA